MTPNNPDRRRFLGAAAITVAGAGLGLYAAQSPLVLPASAARGEELDALARANGWLNSDPLSAADLRGKVVLVQFWTYTCINWLRTMPYIRAWAQRYASHGLVVIGVHSPEFPFEHDHDRVRNATRELHVNHAVAIDNEFAIWRAFGNHYWPALYLFDSAGRLRYRHFGEGEYDETERAIQALLKQGGRPGLPAGLSIVSAQGVEADADWNNLRSREAYVGKARGEGFASLEGDWSVGQWSALLRQARGRVSCRFHARDLHLVMGSSSDRRISFRVSLDGQAPGSARGVDVDDRGDGLLSSPRMYQLIRQTGRIEARRFSIEFLNSGPEVFAFTFG